MKTTIDLPDELVRAIKTRAVEEDKTLRDLVAELLRRGLLDLDPSARASHYIKGPLIRASRKAPSEDELTPERIKQLLIDEEAERALRG